MRKTYSVTELTFLIKGLLERDPALVSVSVVGEVSGLKTYQSGHTYFTMKDKDASIRCVWFGKGARRKIGFKDGDEVVASGKINVYPPRGEYQLVVFEVVQKGAGELAAAYEKLKEKLRKEGLFDEERKLSIPVLPRRIAIITSPTTAALQDMLNIHSKNAPHIEVRLFASLVQGDAAPPELLQALHAAQADPAGFDVIIIARGGGSIEDLWCFNDEDFGRAVADSIIPTISGVGHESDTTICDFVSDLRAPTPTAAMEIATGNWPDVLKEYMLIRERISEWAGRRLSRIMGDFSAVAEFKAARALVGRIENAEQSLDDALRIVAAIPELLDGMRDEARAMLDHRAIGGMLKGFDMLGGATARLASAPPRSVMQAILKRADELGAVRAAVQACDLKKQLKRGFSVVSRARDGEVVTGPDEVKRGEAILVRAHKGDYRARVDEPNENDGGKK
ncbi:exodeoxyribonuclease VII large subunit [bacterium]|nr:exodeoxyribonuclease VII large subunit [bacterium]